MNFISINDINTWDKHLSVCNCEICVKVRRFKRSLGKIRYELVLKQRLIME